MCGSRHHRHQHHHAAAVADRPRQTMPADEIRASDAERESIVTDLRAHAGDGRLQVDELERRIEAAYAATTRAELAALTSDLPRAPRAHGTRTRGGTPADVREHVRAYLMVMALLVAIWLLTGAGYPWPVWPALGWGIGLLSHVSARGRAPTRA